MILEKTYVAQCDACGKQAECEENNTLLPKNWSKAEMNGSAWKYEYYFHICDECMADSHERPTPGLFRKLFFGEKKNYKQEKIK